MIRDASEKEAITSHDPTIHVRTNDYWIFYLIMCDDFKCKLYRIKGLSVLGFSISMEGEILIKRKSLFLSSSLFEDKKDMLRLEYTSKNVVN